MFRTGSDFLCAFITGLYDGAGGRLGLDGVVVEDRRLALKILCLGPELNRTRTTTATLVMCTCSGWVRFKVSAAMVRSHGSIWRFQSSLL